jgi:hypothetical protein
MASAQGIRAGRAFVELFADDSKLVRGLRSAERKLMAFGTAVKDIGAKLAKVGMVALTPMLASAKSFASAGSAMLEMSQRTGVSVEALSELKFAAEQTGVGVEELENGIRKMQKAVVEAAKGSSSARQNLALLGLAVKDLDGLSPDEQFKLIADRLSQIEDPTVRAAMAMEFFGKSGTALLPMLVGGAAGIDAFAAQARALGLVMSTESAESAHKFSQALDILWRVIRSGVNAIGSALAPALTQVAQHVARYLVMAADWLRQNKELVLTIFKVAAAVVAGGLAIVGLGYVIIGVGKALGLLSAIVTGVGTIFRVLGAVLAWLLSPIGLVIAAVVALAGYILYATGAGGKALAWLGERFNELKEDALAAFGGISDALAAGDIGLAAKILWLTLKMEWQKGVNWISGIWNEALLWLRQRATEAFYGLVMGLETIWHGLEVAWIETTAFLSGVWTNFCAGIQQAWMWVSKSLEQTWNKLKGVFDSSFNADSANAALEGKYQAARDEMWNQAKQQLGERDAQRAKERDEEAKTHQDTMGNLLREGEEAKSRQQKEYEDKLAGNQAELDAAKKEWQDAIAAAKDKRKAKEAQGPDAMQSPDDLLAKAQKQLGGLDDVMNATAKRTVGVRGTFNALEAGGLGAGAAVDRIASATEATAQNTASLVKKAGNGLAFTR